MQGGDPITTWNLPKPDAIARVDAASEAGRLIRSFDAAIRAYFPARESVADALDAITLGVALLRAGRTPCRSSTLVPLGVVQSHRAGPSFAFDNSTMDPSSRPLLRALGWCLIVLTGCALLAWQFIVRGLLALGGAEPLYKSDWALVMATYVALPAVWFACGLLLARSLRAVIWLLPFLFAMAITATLAGRALGPSF